jgi:hypothetical protein
MARGCELGRILTRRRMPAARLGVNEKPFVIVHQSVGCVQDAVGICACLVTGIAQHADNRRGAFDVRKLGGSGRVSRRDSVLMSPMSDKRGVAVGGGPLIQEISRLPDTSARLESWLPRAGVAPATTAATAPVAALLRPWPIDRTRCITSRARGPGRANGPRRGVRRRNRSRHGSGPRPS